VVNHEFRGRQRVDPRRVTPEFRHRLAHGREVHHARHAGEVLHHHARGRELDLGVRLRVRVPLRERPDVVRGDVGAVLRAQEVLREDLQAEGEPREAFDGGE